MTIHKVNDLSEKAYMYVKGQTGARPCCCLSCYARQRT